MINKVKYQEKL